MVLTIHGGQANGTPLPTHPDSQLRNWTAIDGSNIGRAARDQASLSCSLSGLATVAVAAVAYDSARSYHIRKKLGLATRAQVAA